MLLSLVLPTGGSPPTGYQMISLQIMFKLCKLAGAHVAAFQVSNVTAYCFSLGAHTRLRLFTEIGHFQ